MLCNLCSIWDAVLDRCCIVIVVKIAGWYSNAIFKPYQYKHFPQYTFHKVTIWPEMARYSHQIRKAQTDYDYFRLLWSHALGYCFSNSYLNEASKLMNIGQPIYL